MSHPSNLKNIATTSSGILSRLPISGRDAVIVIAVCILLLLDALFVKAVSPIPIETVTARGIDYAAYAEPDGAWTELSHLKGSFYTRYSGEVPAASEETVTYFYKDADGDPLFEVTELGADGLYSFKVGDKTTTYKLFSLPRGRTPHDTDGLE